MGNMSGLRQFYNMLWVFGTLVFFIACGGETATQVDDDEEVIEVGADEEADVEDLVHHTVPSPHEMMEFIKSSGSEFRKDLLCPTETHEKYVDMKGKAMGMGVYIADLAYTASFSEFQESIKYFNVIVKMADDVGIASVFDEAMLERIKNNLDHSDSLDAISTHSYHSIVAELEKNDRGKVVAMIAAGGFIESIWLATQLVDKFDANDPLMKRIADQKLVYENIMAYLEQYKDDQNVEWAIMEMSALKAIYEEVSDNRKDSKFSEGQGGKKVLGGTGGVYITEQEFEELRHQAAFLRNSLTFNNPVPQ